MWLGLPLQATPLELRARIPDRVADSIEWMVADSDLIAHIEVIKTDRIEGGMTAWQIVQGRMIETLKGQSSETVTFAARGFAPAIGTDWVVFLNRRKEFGAGSDLAGRAGYELRQHDGRIGRGTPQVIGQNRRLPAITIDEQFLLQQDEIISFLQKSLLQSSRVKPPSMLLPRVPPVPAVDYPAPELPYWLRVPVDGQLELHARRWASEAALYDPLDPDTAIAYLRAGRKRIDAARVLGQFKREENRRVLQGLMQDDFSDDVHSTGIPRWGVNKLPVRHAAWKTLNDWGDDVAQPPREVPGDLYRTATRTLIGFGLILAAIAFRMRRCLDLFLIIPIVLLAILWCRSHSRIDAWVWAPSSVRLDLLVSNGYAQFTTTHDWKNSGPLGHLELPGKTFQNDFEWDAATPPVPPQWKFVGVSRGQLNSTTQQSFLLIPVSRVTLALASLAVPLWFLRLARFLRALHRRKHGRCLRCGYDLRHSPSRCPECGALTAA